VWRVKDADDESKAELRDRVEARKRELEARIATLKADARASARDEVNELDAKLRDLQQTTKEGWEALTEATAAKLNQWLESAR
jgi:chaperonin cofactor prefoldin